MISPQRRWDKIRRMESKIMAYKIMLDSGTVPKTNEIINFHKSRWGEEVMDLERARAYQAMFDLKTDILKNLTGMELTEKDYLKQLKDRELEDTIAVFSGIKDPKAPKPAKKEKKEAKDDAEA